MVVPVVAVLLWQRARRGIRASATVVGGPCVSRSRVGSSGAHRGDKERGLGHDAGADVAGLRRDQPARQRMVLRGGRAVPGLVHAAGVGGLSGPAAERGAWRWPATSCCSSAIALLFYAGSYDYGADVRYSLATYPPLAMLGGLGLARLVGLVRSRPVRTARASSALACARDAIPVVPALDPIDEDGAWAARADVRFAQSLVPELPSNAYVLTQNPGMFQVWGVSAGQTSLVVAEPGSPSGSDSTVRAAGCIFHWNFWCNVQDPVQRKLLHRASRARAQPCGARRGCSGPAVRAIPVADRRRAALK